ncbi:MAG: DUF1294 domain-containing protein [Candidatus Brockarchaeota archaeon]|nr:DUF1294 domain-containing protein [Candidatus Brockarchaeota archaeon]
MRAIIPLFNLMTAFFVFEGSQYIAGRELIIMFKELIYNYLSLVNIAGFILMGVDKASAIRSETRIPEGWFFAISSIGGPFGVFLGMLVFHHKTRKAYFWFIVTLMSILYAFILIVLMRV